MLDFGSRGQPVELYKTKQQIINLTNVGSHKAQFLIKPLFGTSEKDQMKWKLKVEPNEGVCKRGQSIAVTFQLQIFERASCVTELLMIEVAGGHRILATLEVNAMPAGKSTLVAFVSLI